LLREIVESLNRLFGSDCALLIRASRGGGSEKGHDRGQLQREVYLEDSGVKFVDLSQPSDI
jgi:hypothetical protein